MAPILHFLGLFAYPGLSRVCLVDTSVTADSGKLRSFRSIQDWNPKQPEFKTQHPAPLILDGGGGGGIDCHFGLIDALLQ